MSPGQTKTESSRPRVAKGLRDLREVKVRVRRMTSNECGDSFGSDANIPELDLYGCRIVNIVKFTL